MELLGGKSSEAEHSPDNSKISCSFYPNPISIEMQLRVTFADNSQH